MLTRKVLVLILILVLLAAVAAWSALYRPHGEDQGSRPRGSDEPPARSQREPGR